MVRTPVAITAYLKALPPAHRRALQQLRRVIEQVAPGAEPCLSYGMLAFRLGRMLVGIGATANHCAFYLMSTSVLRLHRDLVRDLDASAGTIRFQADAPLPARLVKTLVQARLAENAALPPLRLPGRRAETAPTSTPRRTVPRRRQS